MNQIEIYKCRNCDKPVTVSDDQFPNLYRTFDYFTCPECRTPQFERNDLLAKMKEALEETEWNAQDPILCVCGDEGTFWFHAFISILHNMKEQSEYQKKQTEGRLDSFEKLVQDCDEKNNELYDHAITAWDFDDMTEEEAEEWARGEANTVYEFAKEGLQDLINYVETYT